MLKFFLKDKQAMGLDFNKFIDVNNHLKNIERGEQKVRSNYAMRPAATNEYMHDLFDFFCDDIKVAAGIINDTIMHQKALLGRKMKFSAADLMECIRMGASSFIPAYNRILSSYNMGGMFKDCENFHSVQSLFVTRAEALCKNLGEHFSIAYTEKSKKQFIECMLAFVRSISGIKITVTTGIALFSFLLIHFDDKVAPLVRDLLNKI